MDTNNIFDFKKVNLIIQLGKLNIEKTGSYRIICKLNNAELVELRKHFTIEYQYDIKDNGVYILKQK